MKDIYVSYIAIRFLEMTVIVSQLSLDIRLSSVASRLLFLVDKFRSSEVNKFIGKVIISRSFDIFMSLLCRLDNSITKRMVFSP
jgi:hypothetical protein